MCNPATSRHALVATLLALGSLASAPFAAGEDAAPDEHANHAGHTMPSATPDDAAQDHAPAAEQGDGGGHMSHMDHMQHGATYAPPPVTAADRAAAFPDLGGMHVEHSTLEDPLNKLVLLDRLETQSADGGRLLRWDLESWVGHSLSKLWIRSEGERQAGDTERAELELLWGKSFSRWWELVAGARQDFEPGPAQSWAAVGVRGTAPYRFELDATAYVGEGGQAALRFKGHYELLVTNRLILQPLAELNWYAQRDALRGIDSGLADAELGLRLRYEIRREVAPYVGLVAERKLGGTADLARAAGRDPGDTRLVAGIRLRF